jgi:hypothetical protein
MFEEAAANDSLLVVDHLLAMPTWSDQLKKTAFAYAASGMRKFIQRRILDCVGKRGLVNQFADFWACALVMPIDPQLTRSSPLNGRENLAFALSRNHIISDPQFNLASTCIDGFSAAFEERLCNSGFQPVVRTHRLQVSDVDHKSLFSVIKSDAGGNYLSRQEFLAVMLSTTLNDADCLFLEFTIRPDYRYWYFQFNFDDKNFYRLQFETYDRYFNDQMTL